MIKQTLDIATRDGAMAAFIVFPERWCYGKSAAERQWERLTALYCRRLG